MNRPEDLRRTVAMLVVVSLVTVAVLGAVALVARLLFRQ